MSWTDVSKNTNGSGSATTIATALSTIATTNVIVVGVAWSWVAGAPTCSGVSDGTNSLTALTQNTIDTQLAVQMFYTIGSTLTGPVTYTATVTGATPLAIAAWAFNPSGTATFDTERHDQRSAASAAIATGNITTTGTDELVIAFAMTQNANTYSAQQINSVNAISTNNLSNAAFGSISQWFTTPSSTFTGQGTATITSDRWTSAIAAFNNSGGVAATTAFWHATTRNGP